MPHPLFTLLTAQLIAVSMAAVEDRSARERLYVAARVFVSCVAAVLGGGWLMRLIHG